MRPWSLAHALRRKAAIRRVIDDKRDMIDEMRMKNEVNNRTIPNSRRPIYKF